MVGALLAAVARAEDKPADGAKEKKIPDQVSYFHDIRPLFQDQCQGCHQPAKAGGKFVMVNYAGLLKSGDSEQPGVVPGKPDESLLLSQITPKQGKAEMPKEKPPLVEYQIALIKKWIEQGAKDDSPADTGPVVDAAHPPVYTAPPVLTAIAFSKNGRWMAVSGYHETVLYNGDGSELIGRLVGVSERIESLAFSPDSSRLAVAGGLPGRMGEIQVWDPLDKKLTLSVPVTYDTVYGVSWSHDGSKLAFGCSDNSVRAIDSKTGEQVLFQGAHTDWVHDTVFSKDSTHLITVSRDMSMKLIEVATQRFVDNVTSITPGVLKGGLASIDLRPGQDEVVTGGSDGTPKMFKIYRTQARQIGDDANLLKKFDAVPGRIFATRFNSLGTEIVVGSSHDRQGDVRVYNVADGKLISKISESIGPIYAAAFTADGKLVAAGGFDGQIILMESATGKVLKQFPPVPLAPAQPAAESKAAVIP
jgi:mono/diheme cytochrome c family protein